MAVGKVSGWDLAAACHNGQLEYKGTKIRISGGNANNLDILAFIQGLDDALAATVADSEKFTRLAEKLGKNDESGKEGLRRRLQQDAEAIHRYRSRTALTPIVVGPGRMDALGLIHNQVQSNTMGVPEIGQAVVLLERAAGGLGPVERRTEGSDPPQFGRSDGRVPPSSAS